MFIKDIRHTVKTLCAKNLFESRIEIARVLFFRRPVVLAGEATISLNPVLSRKIHNTFLQEYTRKVIELAHHLIPKEKTIFHKIIYFKN